MIQGTKSRWMRAVLSDHRIVGTALSALVCSFLFVCFCGTMCAEATAVDSVTSPHGGCCSSGHAPAEKGNSSQESRKDGSCECSLTCVQDVQSLVEAPRPAPLPALPLKAREIEIPMELNLNRLSSPPTVFNSSSGPPDYLRFQILLI
jgi:hypothetical protein